MRAQLNLVPKINQPAGEVAGCFCVAQPGGMG